VHHAQIDALAAVTPADLQTLAGWPTALLAMATGIAVPASALGATACAVTARVQRLLDVPGGGRHALRSRP
jgi:hypothetical protein